MNLGRANSAFSVAILLCFVAGVFASKTLGVAHASSCDPYDGREHLQLELHTVVDTATGAAAEEQRASLPSPICLTAGYAGDPDTVELQMGCGSNPTVLRLVR